MSVNIRMVKLDADGHADYTTPPGFFLGASGGGVTGVTSDDGESLGTAILARGSGIPVREVHITGTPNESVTLYLDFD